MALSGPWRQPNRGVTDGQPDTILQAQPDRNTLTGTLPIAIYLGLVDQLAHPLVGLRDGQQDDLGANGPLNANSPSVLSLIRF